MLHILVHVCFLYLFSVVGVLVIILVCASVLIGVYTGVYFACNMNASVLYE